MSEMAKKMAIMTKMAQKLSVVAGTLIGSVKICPKERGPITRKVTNSQQECCG